MKTIAVMQPYLFPYIGYFQLIDSCDLFVFYDDVQYIQRGWINRNRILLNHEPYYITLPVQKKFHRATIRECLLSNEAEREIQRIQKTINRAYKASPYFSNIYPLIQSVFENKSVHISILAEVSILTVMKYLDIKTKTSRSSEIDYNKHLRGERRMIDLVKTLNGNRYINPIGGAELYTPEQFKDVGIELKFLQSKPLSYTQFKKPFVPYLSIIDVLMFNPVEKVKVMLKEYELV
ncbi:MAG TPA: hypothetical protein ENN22_05010 [bacterium]|nr:hypothetical protein [bacterium]